MTQVLAPPAVPVSPVLSCTQLRATKAGARTPPPPRVRYTQQLQPTITVRRRRAASVARNERRRAGWWSSPPVKTGVSHEIRGSSFYRPQNRLQPAATAGGAAPQPDPTVYRLQPELDQGGDPPEPCPHLMETPTAAAAVSPSPGDTVSAPCRIACKLHYFMRTRLKLHYFMRKTRPQLRGR